jgi:hypothetical protein
MNNNGCMAQGIFGPSSGGPKFNIGNDECMAQGIFGQSFRVQCLT